MALLGSRSSVLTWKASPFDFSAWAISFNRPNCGSDFVFLVEAVEEIGRLLFEDKWTGDECRELTNHALYNLPPPKFGSSDRLAHVPPDLKTAHAAKYRAIAVMTAIREAGIAGHLETFLFVEPQAAMDLQPFPQSKAFWYGSDRLIHFFHSKGQILAPNGGVLEGWIFVSRESLDKGLTIIGDTTAKLSPAQIAGMPSPLKMALEIYGQHPTVTDMKPPGRDKLVRAAWKRAYPEAESESYIKAIIAVLGDPPLARISRAKGSAGKSARGK